MSNLTDVIIQLSGVDSSLLSLPLPVAFEPDPGSVRLNVYWSLSLIVSVSRYFDRLRLLQITDVNSSFVSLL